MGAKILHVHLLHNWFYPSKLVFFQPAMFGCQVQWVALTADFANQAAFSRSLIMVMTSQAPSSRQRLGSCSSGISFGSSVSEDDDDHDESYPNPRAKTTKTIHQLSRNFLILWRFPQTWILYLQIIHLIFGFVKTISFLGSPHWKLLQVQTQPSIWRHLARLFGHHVVGRRP